MLHLVKCAERCVWGHFCWLRWLACHSVWWRSARSSVRCRIFAIRASNGEKMEQTPRAAFRSSARLRPVHPCATRSAGTNETKTGSVIRVMIVPGGILAAIAFGILGAARARPRLAVAGACLMLVEAVPLMFSIAPLAMVAAAALLVVAALSRRVPPRFAEGMLP
jgi:hypothetical protein